ncbi:hypothetical protein Aeqsu_2771 [Aequorivita sublithincola DSM 14238]|uniref:MerR HTH family regulatory protein n=1 Tax=Aequorivita sublithincola (strain DSM 14238 / LMG 21431 / ACAM 643 / 9-3) TaxID=746697 RepID=I3YZ03_AEQSU|nr:chaperone modulator CbpM [Aequorivita sublithincola]AFL82221.1 hypothetical protein Aeqsu_2771 [Aequorivita sublithincola DSM 14238]
MAREKYILVSHYCEQTHIENSFVKNLHEYGLVTFEEKQNDVFIDEKDISEIEKMFRLHHELGINFEGLDALKQMLKRLEKMQKQMELLQKKLGLYE